MVDETKNYSLTEEFVIDFTDELRKHIGTSVGVVVLVVDDSGTEVRTNLESEYLTTLFADMCLFYHYKPSDGVDDVKASETIDTEGVN